MKDPLDFSREETIRMTTKALNELFDALEHPEYGVSSGLEEAQVLARDLVASIPRKGEKFEALVKDLVTNYFPEVINATSPRCFSFIPGSGSTPASIADLLSTLVNCPGSLGGFTPCLSQMESNVLRWFREIMGYGKQARGVLTPGGSTANLYALVVAREKLLQGKNPRRGVVYASQHVHHCIEKAMRVAAIPLENLRSIKMDSLFRIDCSELENHILKDKAQGLIPFFVVGSAGTTNTGAVDPLHEIDLLAKKYHLWFHVDGAYGGFFRMTERGADQLTGIEQADSIVIDPHKALFMPFGLGCLLVRDGRDMISAFAPAHQGDYLLRLDETFDPDDRKAWNFHDLSPELMRDARGVRAWLPLKLYGLDRFQALLDEKLDLIQYAYQELLKLPEIQVVTRPSLSILTFRYFKEGWSRDVADVENRKRLEAIIARNRVHLSSTQIEGNFVIRICILSHRSHELHVEELLDEIRYQCASDPAVAARKPRWNN